MFLHVCRALSTAARDRLSELTSKDGDWFLDELCTMSGNVSQMISLLEMCLKYMGLDIQQGGVLVATITAVNSVHEVYSSMQVREGGRERGRRWEYGGNGERV